MFQGSIVAIITPMLADGSVDFAGLDNLIEYQISNGTDAIVAVGTTGESPTLSFEEHMEVIAHVQQKVAGRCPVIAGTGSNNTRDAIKNTREAERIGVDGCLVVAPYYNKPTQTGLYEHFTAIAESTSLPICLYNVPGRTVADIQAETALKLAELDNIIAIKEANTIERIRALIDTVGDKLTVLTGDDPVTVDTIAAGGKGVISVTANIAPALVKTVCDLALAGDIETARTKEQALMPLHNLLFVESNPIPTKWALHHLGLCAGGIRLPLTPLSEAHHAPLIAAMQALDIKNA